jgi:hypothetical protein
MFKWFWKWVDSREFDPLIEGVHAHQYNNEDVRQRITQAYKAKYMPSKTPLTNPELYDPMNPPEGWAWDPYYELWLKIDE